MSTETESEVQICPHCGAENEPHYTVCWLCFHVPGDRGERPRAGTGRGAANEGAIAATIGGAVALGLVTVGLSTFAPGLALLVLVLGVPPVVIAAVRARRGPRARHVSTTRNVIEQFLLSTITVVGSVFLILAAAAVAFFLFCFAICAFQ
jgi:hypothetical protein